MDDNKKMQELLEHLEESNRKQARYGLIQCIFSAVAVVCCIVLFLMVNQALPQAKELMTQMQGMMTQMEGTMSNLEQITTDLAEVDLASMVSNVDQLVSTGQSSITETMEKLNMIDFAALNQAIKNLSDVIEPLVKFFGMFN